MRLLSTLFFSLALFSFAVSQAQRPEAIPGDILVMLMPGASPQQIVDDVARLDRGASGLHVEREISAPMRTWLLQFDASAVSQVEMLRTVRQHHAVQLAQNNHQLKLRVLPNDDGFAAQWHHTNIDSQQAWDITTGGITATGDTIVVCIVENANLPHPDLLANAWFNRNEVPNNNVDDDGNGYVDDYQGWDADANDDQIYGGSHGTQVAGMIGSVGNNGSQVVGANWAVKMMVVANTGASDAGVIASHTYPLVMRRLYNQTDGAQGAFVVATNASWGIDGGQPDDAPLWCAMYDTLGTAGILNCGATANNNVDIDVVGDLPTACPSDFMISVTATNIDDQRTFSGYGLTTIDVGAPGSSVVTTNINGGTGSTSGTSFASPLTAGVIALLYSAPCASLMDLVQSDAQAGALYVRQALFNGVEQVGNLPGNTVTGGRINSYNSLQWIMNGCGACPVPYNLNATVNDLSNATLAWSNSTGGLVNVRYRQLGSTDWTTVFNWNENVLNLGFLIACTPYEFQVESICDNTTSGFSASSVFTSEGCCTAPASITASAVDPANANVIWNTVLAASTYDLRYGLLGSNNWTALNGLTGSAASLSGLSGCSNYEVQMRSTCNGITTSDWGTSALFNTPGCGQCVDATFCPSVADDATTEWIDRVRLNSIDNESGNDDGYNAFTDQSTTLVIGQSYPIILTPGFSNFNYPEYWKVWIDLDGDTQFESPSELVFDAGQTDQAEITGSLVVPVGSPVGATRLRVIMKYNAPATDGCETGYGYGETEDYCVNLETAQGINDGLASANVMLFPNPADQHIVIELPLSLAGVYSIEVLDSAGKLVAAKNLTGARINLSTTSFGNGLYLYRVLNNGSEIARGKFEVVHF
ncbi:MAG: S8 family serine peptidase [Flavobacteriales bacterium]|nr:S8 family serine peptidase [Flavobacteriales bacterium]